MYTWNQAWVYINSHISADMWFGTWMNSFLTCRLNVVSQTYVYIKFLTGNDIKETRSRTYWHIIAGSQYSAKWYMVNINCCTTTAVKPVHNTLWCSSVPSTVTELQIYLNCGSVLGWGNRSIFPSVLTRSGNPSALLSMCTGGSFTGNNKAVALSWPLTCI